MNGWTRKRRRALLQMAERKDFDCPTCGRFMFFKGVKLYRDFKDDYETKFGERPNKKTCHRHVATLDHIVPKKHGGAHSENNGMIICSDCNHDKGSDSVRKWIKRRVTQNNPFPPEIVNYLLEKHRKAITP